MIQAWMCRRVTSSHDSAGSASSSPRPVHQPIREPFGSRRCRSGLCCRTCSQLAALAGRKRCRFRTWRRRRRKGASDPIPDRDGVMGLAKTFAPLLIRERRWLASGEDRFDRSLTPTEGVFDAGQEFAPERNRLTPFQCAVLGGLYMGVGGDGLLSAARGEARCAERLPKSFHAVPSYGLRCPIRAANARRPLSRTFVQRDKVADGAVLGGLGCLPGGVLIPGDAVRAVPPGRIPSVADHSKKQVVGHAYRRGSPPDAARWIGASMRTISKRS